MYKYSIGKDDFGRNWREVNADTFEERNGVYFFYKDEEIIQALGISGNQEVVIKKIIKCKECGKEVN